MSQHTACPLLRERSAGVLAATVTSSSRDSSHTLFRVARLPAGLEAGDRVYIVSARPYSLCYAAPFNGYLVPGPVYLS